MVSRIRSDRLARRLEQGWQRIMEEQDAAAKVKLEAFWLDLLAEYEQEYDAETEAHERDTPG